MVALLASPLVAQSDRQDEQTGLQNATEATTRTVCVAMSGLPSLTPIERNLFEQCSSMVNTANSKDGLPANPDFVLDISDSELRGAWQNLAGEEFATQGTMGTKISTGQFGNILQRLMRLRSGVSGVSVADLGFVADGALVRASSVLSQDRSEPTGGAASADDTETERWGIFLNGIVGFGDRTGTSREDGFEFDTSGVTLGADYRLSSKWVFGGAIGYGSIDTDLDYTTDPASSEAVLVEGGDVDVSGTSGMLYLASFGERFYFDLAAGYGQDGYDIRRQVTYATGPSSRLQRTATADPDGTHWGATIGGGYEKASGSWTYGPYLRVSSQSVEIDSYVEQGSVSSLALEVDAQDYDSLVSVVGMDVAKVASQSWGVLIPQLRAEWNHEFENDSQLIHTRYFYDPLKSEPGHELLARTDEPDRDFFIASLSLSAVFKGGNQAFINYDVLLDYLDISSNVFTVGVRFAF